MLILTRREGEEIQIGPDVVVMVTQVRGGQVKLGFRAPRCVEIYRREIVERHDFTKDRPARPR